MKRTLVGVVGLAVAAVLLLGADPASAEEAHISDATDDASSPGLDITRMSVDNRDDAVVVTVRFTRSVGSDLIVSVDPRRGPGVRLVSRYRPTGHTVNSVVGRAFTDHGGSTDLVKCPGFRVKWSAERPTVRLRMPATCLADGDYGAIRFGALTERTGGADTDAAPEDGSSRWVARG